MPTLTCDTSIEDMSRRVMLAVRYAISVTPTAYGDEHGRDQARIVAEMEALRGAALNDWLRGLVRAAVSREVARQALGVVS